MEKSSATRVWEMEKSFGESLIPRFLYSKPTIGLVTSSNMAFVIPAPSEKPRKNIDSPAFYATCTVGGFLSCGLTHLAVTPLDLLKSNMQLVQGHCSIMGSPNSMQD